MVPWHLRPDSILSSLRTAGLFSRTSVIFVETALAAESIDADDEEEEEEFNLYPVSCQIKTPLFTQLAVSVTCQGEGLLLMEAHPNVIKRQRWIRKGESWMYSLMIFSTSIFTSQTCQGKPSLSRIIRYSHRLLLPLHTLYTHKAMSPAQ